MKTFEVTDCNGATVVVKADFMFEEDALLKLKVGTRCDSETVAVYAPGRWIGVRKIAEEAGQ